MSHASYLHVTGQEAIKRALSRALREGRVPQTLLLHGPRGVGKQRLALWFAALAQCERPGDEPCGRCRSCRLAARLEHPDIHWFFPTARPRATSPEALREKIEEIRAEELEERRAGPTYTRSLGEPVGIYLAAAQNLRSLASALPAASRRTIVIIGDAEALVPQEASPDAANALLKLLEEPPLTSLIMLTSAVPGALLPTIRSRCLAMRVPPLSEDEVANFLRTELKRPAREAEHLARRAHGSIGRALELLREEAQQNREEAEHLLEAALVADPLRTLETAHGYRPFGARGGFLEVLDELQALLSEALAVAVSAATDARGAATAAKLVSSPSVQKLDASAIAQAILAIERARSMAEGNVNPQLIVATLLGRLRILLSGSEPTDPRVR